MIRWGHPIREGPMEKPEATSEPLGPVSSELCAGKSLNLNTPVQPFAPRLDCDKSRSQANLCHRHVGWLEQHSR